MREDNPLWKKLLVFVAFFLGMPSPIYVLFYLIRDRSTWVEYFLEALFILVAFTFAFFMVFNHMWWSQRDTTGD